MFFGFGFGMGNVIAPASTVMQNVLPLGRAGAGSAVQNTVRQVFGALGVAVIGTLLATTYASNVAPTLAPLPPAARSVAEDSIIATDRVLTVAASQGATPEQVAQLRLGAYDAFLKSSHVTSAISASVVLLAALIVGFLLPYIPPPGKRRRDDEQPEAGPAAGGTDMVEG